MNSIICSAMSNRPSCLRLKNPIVVLWILGFPCVSAGKEFAYNAGRAGSDPWVGMIPANGKPHHSSILCWKIPWTAQYMESQKVGHDWPTFTSNSPKTKPATWNGNHNKPPKAKNIHLASVIFQVLLFDTKILVLFNLTRPPKIIGKEFLSWFYLILVCLAVPGTKMK